MCRLFGMHGGRRRMRATFWLVEAPDSLAEQSRRNPDGYGIGTYSEDGTPEVAKRPAAAYADKQFARRAREEESQTFLAHVRYASSGDRSPQNTHPFEQAGRLFAHNGAVLGMDALDARLGEHRRLVAGDTDSERVFALITQAVEERGGDIVAGVAAAVDWIARELPLFALNFVLTTPEELWAFRYPEAHELLMLERASGGPTGARHLDAASGAGTVRVRAAALADRASVLFASERMDEDAGWVGLGSGELVHVDPDLEVTRHTVIDRPPAHQLRLEDLDPRAAASQRMQPTLAAR
jgi:predicted glutamine amidotransferase